MAAKKRMYVVLPVDGLGDPDDDGLHKNLTVARQTRRELNAEAESGDPQWAVFELREVD